MATTVNGYVNDKVDGNPLSAAEVNALGDGSELHHVNFAELFGPGVIGASDWNLGIVAGQIALTITAGQGIVGDAGERKVVETTSAVTITATQGLGASNTYYVFKKRDLGTVGDDATGFVANTSGTAPADSILIGSAVFDTTEATSVSSYPSGRVNHPATPLWVMRAGTDKILRSQVTGDSQDRWYVDANGAFRWGPGNAAIDLILERLSAGLAKLTGGLTQAPAGGADLARVATSTGNLIESAKAYVGYWIIRGMRSQGTPGSESVPTTGSELLGIEAGGWETSWRTTQAAIRFKAGSDWTGSNYETYFGWHTTPASSTTLTARGRFDSAGAVVIGADQNANANSLLDIVSTTKAARPLPSATTAQIDAMTGVEGGGAYDTSRSAPRFYGVQWKWMVAGHFAKRAGTTIANSAVEATLLGTLTTGTKTLAANYWKVGRSLTLEAWGHVSNTGTPNLTFTVKFGSTTLGSVVVATASGLSQHLWHAKINTICRAVGGSGTVITFGYVLINGTIYSIVSTATVTIDTTASGDFDLTGTWGTASSSNTITCHNAILREDC